MSNLYGIKSTDADEIKSVLSAHSVSRAHFTNGIYAGNPKIFLPTNLACFQMIAEKRELVRPTDAFIIAVNSNVSLEKANEKKRQRGESVPTIQGQFERALNISRYIAYQFRDRKVFALFYDEDAPAAANNQDVQQDDGLYNRLQERGVELATLSKGGFGTDPKKGPIIGAELFERVYAYPFPNDTAHIQNYCANVSGKPIPLPENVEVLKLTEEIGDHGQPYMTEGNKVLFPVRHPHLSQFTA